MNEISRNMKAEPRPIRQLDDAAANRIAADEVVERPASAVKELVENALDAGASRIAVAIADGGKRLIEISDDGHGIAPDQLALALSRHATSKLDGDDLLNIRFLGFRGEALASLGAVGRLTLESRSPGQEAAEIAVDGGRAGAMRPAAPRTWLEATRFEEQAMSDFLLKLSQNRTKRAALSDPLMSRAPARTCGWLATMPTVLPPRRANPVRMFCAKCSCT